MNTEGPEMDGTRPTRRPSRGAVVLVVTAAVLALGGGGGWLAVGAVSDPGRPAAASAHAASSGNVPGASLGSVPGTSAGNSPDGPSPSPLAPGGRSDDAPSKHRTRNIPVGGYHAQDSELTVTFTGGVCGTYAVSAKERSDRVEVRVTHTYDPDEICVALAKLYHRTVHLKAPLGDRTVVGSDGKPVAPEKPHLVRPRR